jgi:hypothetical protein
MLKIAHISDGPCKPKKLTQKELIHNAAIQSLAERRAKDKAEAIKKFSKQIEELEELEYYANQKDNV